MRQNLPVHTRMGKSLSFLHFHAVGRRDCKQYFGSSGQYAITGCFLHLREKTMSKKFQEFPSRSFLQEISSYMFKFTYKLELSVWPFQSLFT